MKNQKIICLFFGFGAGARKKEESHIERIPQKEMKKPIPVGIIISEQKSKKMAYKDEIFNISFQCKKMSVYKVYVRERYLNCSIFPQGIRSSR